MKRAAADEEERRAEQRRKEKLSQWHRGRVAKERRLRLAAKQAAEDVAAAERALAKLRATAVAAPAAAGLEDSSDEEGAQTLAQRAVFGGKPSSGGAKRKAAAVLDDLSGEDTDKEGPASGRRPASQAAVRRRVNWESRAHVCVCLQAAQLLPACLCAAPAVHPGSQAPSKSCASPSHRSAYLALQVMDDSDSSDDDGVPLSERPPLAPRTVDPPPQLSFRRLAQPVEIDLTLGGDDLCCMVGRRGWGFQIKGLGGGRAKPPRVAVALVLAACRHGRTVGRQEALTILWSTAGLRAPAGVRTRGR